MPFLDRSLHLDERKDRRCRAIRSLAEPEQVRRRIDLDQRYVAQRGGESFGMIEADRPVVARGQDQRRLCDVAADIGRGAKIYQEAPTGLAAQEKLVDLARRLPRAGALLLLRRVW